MARRVDDAVPAEAVDRASAPLAGARRAGDGVRGRGSGGQRGRQFADLGERGQALPLVIGVVAVMAAMVLGVGWFAAGVVDAAGARTAADAAALAGAVDGRSAAAELAAHNGATLVGVEQVGDDVIVTVRRGRAVASARATANRAVLSTLAFRDADQPAG